MGVGEEDDREAGDLEGFSPEEISLMGLIGEERVEREGTPRGFGQPRQLAWDPMDPIFSTTDLFRWLERPLRYTGTIGVLAHLFGNAVIDGSDVEATIRNMGVRRLVEVQPPPEVIKKLPPHRQFLHALVSAERAEGRTEDIPVNPLKIHRLGGDKTGLPEGMSLVRKHQRWFVFSGTKSQYYDRTYRTGWTKWHFPTLGKQ